MAGFEGGGGMGLVLDRQEQTVPKNTPDIVLAYAPPSGDFTSAIRNQEREERRQTIQETEFLTPEEKLALLSEVNTDKKVFLATNENPQGDWKDLALDIGKDLLVPDELDVAFFLAAGPGGLVLRRLSKAPEVVQKLLKYFDPKALETIERAIDLLATKGDSEGVKSIVDVLRGSTNPKKREMGKELEKLVESRTPKSVGPKEVKKIEERVPREPKLEEITEAEAKLYAGTQQWRLENSLHPLFNTDGKKKIEVLLTKGEEELINYERYIVYHREKLKTPNIDTKVSDYLQIFGDMVYGYTKEKVNFTSIKEAKDYILKIKSTHGRTQ